MNRFDPGHSTPKDRSTLLPTSLMPGDIPIKTQVRLMCSFMVSELSLGQGYN